MNALVDLLTGQRRGEKVLVFTEYSDTAEYIEAALTNAGIDDAPSGQIGERGHPRLDPLPFLVIILYQRTVRKRCSSIPRFDTRTGRAAARAARVIVSCRITVGHETPSSAATRLTARTSPDRAVTIRSFNRAVSRARGGICSVCSVNMTVPHSGSANRHRFLTHHTLAVPSKVTSRPCCRVR